MRSCDFSGACGSSRSGPSAWRGRALRAATSSRGKLQDAHRQGLRRSDYGIFEGIEISPPPRLTGAAACGIALLRGSGAIPDRRGTGSAELAPEQVRALAPRPALRDPPTEPRSSPVPPREPSALPWRQLRPRARHWQPRRPVPRGKTAPGTSAPRPAPPRSGRLRPGCSALHTGKDRLRLGIACAPAAMRDQALIYLLLPGGQSCSHFGRIVIVDGALRRSTQR